MKHFNSMEARDIAHVLHCATDAVVHAEIGPTVIVRGEGVFIYDSEGKRYLEGMSGMWSAGLGFSEKRLGEAAKRQMDTLPFYHIFAHRSTPVVIDLAEKLIQMAPVPMSKAFFTNSGSEANDTVMKFLWYRARAMGKPEKRKIITRHRAYHGATIGTVCLTGLEVNHRNFDLLVSDVIRLTCPHLYRDGLPDETEEEFSTRLASELEQKILEEGPETVAAFIAEPVMGGGGVIVPPAGYWEKMQTVLKKYDILLIADEVINGFGRTGKMFGSELYGIEPDVIVLSKQLTSSYIPFAAILMNDKFVDPIMQASHELGGLFHGFTNCGHPVASAVALETIKIVEERNLPARAEAMGERLRAGLSKYLSHPLVGEVRGVGLLAAVELVTDKVTKAGLGKVGKLAEIAADKMHDHGVITRPVYDALIFCPPMIISEEEVELIVDTLGKTLDELLADIKAIPV